MKTWYVYANPKARSIGVGPSNPPVTGGEIFDSFEHEGGTHEDRLRIANERNGPIRLERFEQGSWQPYPECFAAAGSGYDEAIMFLQAMSRYGTHAQMRLVTRAGTVVPHES